MRVLACTATAFVAALATPPAARAQAVIRMATPVPEGLLADYRAEHRGIEGQ